MPWQRQVRCGAELTISDGDVGVGEDVTVDLVSYFSRERKETEMVKRSFWRGRNDGN